MNSVTQLYGHQWRSQTHRQRHTNSFVLNHLVGDFFSFFFYVTSNALNISSFMWACMRVWSIAELLPPPRKSRCTGKQMLSLHCFPSLWLVEIKARICVSLLVFIEQILKRIHIGCSWEIILCCALKQGAGAQKWFPEPSEEVLM